jgi:hypothetical protein
MSDIRNLYKLVRSLEDTEISESIEIHDSFDIELSESFVIETGVVGFTEDGIIVEADEQTLEFLEINDVLIESEEVEESGLQAYLGNKKYGKEGMDALRKAGRDHASKEKMANIRAKYDKLDEEDNEDELSEIKRLSAIHEDNDSAEAVYNAVVRRIMMQHTDVLGKFGPKAVMSAIEDIASNVGDLDEIGSSDVSIWTKQVIQDLEAGHYDHLKEAEYQGRKVPLGKPMQGDVAKSKVYVRKPNGKVVKVNFGDKNMRIKKSNPGRRKNFRARHNCDNPGPRWKARYWSCRAW